MNDDDPVWVQLIAAAFGFAEYFVVGTLILRGLERVLGVH